mgnify:CR=1 FL=1
MKKLIQQLIKASDSYSESISTFSTYYQIKNVTVRVSDHITDKTDSCDLQVINPLNGGTKYIVFSPKSSASFLWNSNEIMNYVSFLVLQKQLESPNIKPTIKVTPQIFTGKIEELVFTTPLLKVIRDGTTKAQQLLVCKSSKTAWKESEIDSAEKLLQEKYFPNENVSFNEDFRLFLMTTPCSFKQLLNIYSIIVRGNKKVITIELANAVLDHLNSL